MVLGMKAMMVKEFRELVRDRRTLAMLIVMPLLLLVIFGYAANFYVSSVGMVRERESGTLEQLAVMPIRPSRVILGKIAPYFLVAALDMIIVTVLGILLFSVPFNGNPFAFALGAAIFLFVVLGLGVFISTISQTVGQAIQTAFFFLLPQILLSGMIFPLEAMAAGVRWIGYLLPLTYFTMISQGIMLRGAPITSLWLPFAVLTAMAVVVFTGATLRFRRDLAPGRPGSQAHAEPAAADAAGAA